MSKFVYTEATNQLLRGNLDFLNDDIQVMLVTTGSTAGVDDSTGRDAVTLSGITTLNEYENVNYSRKALTESVIKSDVNNWSIFDALDVTWPSLFQDDFARQAIALLIFKNLGADNSSFPIAYIDTPAVFPFHGNGSDVTIQWSGNGILIARNV